MNKPCHCSSTKCIENCCLPIIKGVKIASTAEELMRSRYTAYVLADIDYLMASHHPKTRPVKERKNILRWTKSLQWLQLKILDKRAGNINDKEGWVEFKAVFIENGLPQDIHENSYFIKEYGKWYYLSGEHK